MSILDFFDVFFIIFICLLYIILSSSSIVLSVICLVLLFICSSFFFVLLNCTFIGLCFLMVYIGGLSILFIFILMLVNTGLSYLEDSSYFLLGFLFYFIIMLLLFDANINNNSVDLFYLTNFVREFMHPLESLVVDTYNIDVVILKNQSYMLYESEFLFIFLLSGYVLMLLVIGAITIINYIGGFFGKIQEHQLNKSSNILLVSSRSSLSSNPLK